MTLKIISTTLLLIDVLLKENPSEFRIISHNLSPETTVSGKNFRRQQ